MLGEFCGDCGASSRGMCTCARPALTQSPSLTRKIRDTAMGHYLAGRHDEALKVLVRHADYLGLRVQTLHETPTTLAVVEGLRALTCLE